MALVQALCVARMVAHNAPCLCEQCVRAERARIKPYVAFALEALDALGWDDLAREVRRRYALYDVEPLPFEPSAAELERLTYE